MTTRTFELNQAEWEQVAGVLREHKRNLDQYVSWIDERPNLPKTQTAIDLVKETSKLCLSLSYYFQTGKRL